MDFPSSLPFLHFRFTHKNAEELATLHLFMQSLKTPYITTIEEADTEVARTHTHTLIQTDLTVIQFAKRFKAKLYFPNSNGKTDFGTCIVKSPTDMLSYVCKGPDKNTLPHVYYSAWSQEVISNAHKVYWERNKILKTPKTKDKSLSWTQSTAKAFKEAYPDKVSKNCSIDKYFIFSFCLDRMGAEVKVLDDIIIRRLTLGVMNHLITGSARESFKKDLFEKAFPSAYEINEDYSLI